MQSKIREDNIVPVMIFLQHLGYFRGRFLCDIRYGELCPRIRREADNRRSSHYGKSGG